MSLTQCAILGLLYPGWGLPNFNRGALPVLMGGMQQHPTVLSVSLTQCALLGLLFPKLAQRRLPSTVHPVVQDSLLLPVLLHALPVPRAPMLQPMPPAPALIARCMPPPVDEAQCPWRTATVTLMLATMMPMPALTWRASCGASPALYVPPPRLSCSPAGGTGTLCAVHPQLLLHQTAPAAAP